MTWETTVDESERYLSDKKYVVLDDLFNTVNQANFKMNLSSIRRLLKDYSRNKTLRPVYDPVTETYSIMDAKTGYKFNLSKKFTIDMYKEYLELYVGDLPHNIKQDAIEDMLYFTRIRKRLPAY